MQDADAKHCPKGMGRIGCNRAKRKTEEILYTEGWKESIACHAQLQSRALQLDSHFPLSGKTLRKDERASSVLIRKQVWLTL